jgi:hypothetical protein
VKIRIAESIDLGRRGIEAININIIERHINNISKLPKIPKKKKEKRKIK